MDKSRLQLHYLYTVILLLFCLVLVATDRWTGQKNFTEYLTNVATMVSLVLALVAIFYSFISNVGLSQSLGNIERVSNEISSTRVAMEEFVRESHSIVEAGAANATDLRKVSDQVSQEIGSLQSTLVQIRAENAELSASLTPIPDRIEQLSARLAEAAPSTPPAAAPPPAKGEPVNVAEQASRFLKRNSLLGAATALGIALAHSSGKELHSNRIGEIFTGTETYVHGFIVALHSAGVINCVFVADKSRVVEVTRADAFIGELTLDQVRAEIKRRKITAENEWLAKLDVLAAEFVS